MDAQMHFNTNSRSNSVNVYSYSAEFYLHAPVFISQHVDSILFHSAWTHILGWLAVFCDTPLGIREHSTDHLIAY